MMSSIFAKKALLSLSVSFILAGVIQLPGITMSLDMLRDVKLDISAYENLPDRYTTAADVLNTLDTQKNLLVHMETLRKGYFELPEAEQEMLLNRLYERYKKAENDTTKFFDHGYAQVLYKKNKTGLFFLRKANDRIQNQFTSLAYAMAQAEVDVEEEAAPPEEMTVRKLSVIFTFRDALTRHKESPEPGFWPSFVGAIEKLKPLQAYADFTNDDFSLTYVPYGSSVVPTVMQIPASIGGAATSVDDSMSACELKPARLEPDVSLYGSRVVDFDQDKQFELVRFFKQGEAENSKYRVLITDSQGRTMADFESGVAPYIIEDLEGDGNFEVVVRQFKQDPYNPVVVQRLGDCGFEADQSIMNYFK